MCIIAYHSVYSIKQRVSRAFSFLGLLGLLPPDLILDELLQEVDKHVTLAVPELFQRNLVYDRLRAFDAELLLRQSLRYPGLKPDLGYHLIVASAPVYLIDLLDSFALLQAVQCTWHSVEINVLN